MSDESKLLALFLTLALLVLPLIVFSCHVGVTTRDNAAMVEMMKLGATARDARCAVKRCHVENRSVDVLRESK